MHVKTERVTFLATPELKNYLETEASKQGVSIGQLIREKCGQATEEEELLKAVAAQLRREVREAKMALKTANQRVDKLVEASSKPGTKPSRS